MPETARVLPFRAKRSPEHLSTAEALRKAESYLQTPHENRTKALVDSALGDADLLTSICGLLWAQGNSDPTRMASEASQLFSWLTSQVESVGFFDERDFFLGESALLVGAATRLLGRRAETERWLDRAEASFRHTINATPQLARVAYVRLALRYDMRRHEEVLELLPSVALSFKKLGMLTDLAKCRFLEAMSLKELGRIEDAALGLEALATGSEFQVEPGLAATALVNLGDIRSAQGLHDVALKIYARAQGFLEAASRFVALADLKANVAHTLHRLGHIDGAIEAYREAVSDHSRLGLTSRTAYVRVLLAEVLLTAGRAREAEWELLAALPTISEEKMVPEGFAAVALLGESVRQRRTDPKALLELREYLEAKA